MESGVNTMVTDGFETLLDKVEKRLSQHEKLLSTNVAICAERRDSESAMGAKGKITYGGMFLTSVTIGGKAMNRTKLPLRDQSSRRRDEDDTDKSDRQHRTERWRQGVCV